MSILLNQIATWVHSATIWDVHDLRNTVEQIIHTHLAIVGYLKGLASDVEITRVLCPALEVDLVYGIDIPCLTERQKDVEVMRELPRLHHLTFGAEGNLINRCFRDLISAMKNAEDTAFHCYRAIESLRHHCAVKYGLTSANKSIQWQKFRDVANCKEDVVQSLKRAADPLRHGESVALTSAARAELFETTWTIVDGYFDHVAPRSESQPTSSV